MVRSAQSPLGESQPDRSGDVQPTLLEWAQALSYRSRDDEQEISVFEEIMGHLTHTKLLDIVKVARVLQTPEFGLLLFRWIDKRFDTGRETDNHLAKAWALVREVYSAHTSSDHGANDDKITSSVRVSCGMVEARFLELESQDMDHGKLPTSEFREEMTSILHKTSDEHSSVDSLLRMSEILRPSDYDTLSIHEAAKAAQTLCSLIRDLEYQSYMISIADEDRGDNAPAWHGLGCIYIDVAKFVASSSLVKSKRWQSNPHHETDHPYRFLAQAVRCFGQGAGCKSSMYYAWYCERLESHTTDRDQLSIEIGLDLREKATDMMETGFPAMSQARHMDDAFYGQKTRARSKPPRKSSFWIFAWYAAGYVCLIGLVIALALREERRIENSMR
jgi:hypothetical protein